MKKFKILLAIRSLDLGGAERQFVLLAQALQKQAEVETLVCTLYGGGVLEADLEGIPFICIHKKGKSDFLFLRRYRKVIAEYSPNVIYSFMPDMNLFSLFASLKQCKIVWGFRSSSIEVSSLSFFSKLYFYTQRFFSPFADRIICNSCDAIAFYKKYHYTMEKAAVVHNGIDINRFYRQDLEACELKKNLNIPQDYFVFGLSARMDIIKDYPLLARAAREILQKYSAIVFVALGKINPTILQECQAILGEFEKYFLFLGAKKDIERYYRCFDCILSTSYTESFSNSIAEAMASGAIPIVSDCGESAIIANFNQDCYTYLFAPRDLQGLLLALESLLQIRENKELVESLKIQAIEHIKEHFSPQKMCEETLKILREA